MRCAAIAVLALISGWLTYPGSSAFADEPKAVEKPDAFKALVNPTCSHCIEEAKRRAGELRESDPVLCWTRGYSDGGAIPIRFFLAPYRVISDSYGLFVYDPDAGFARGFAPSYNFVFHGWRNGIMTIRDKQDGTLYSALSGVAFAGPKKGQRLQPVSTLTTTWGEWIHQYPHAVAYHMFEKYQPIALPTSDNPNSMKTRPAKCDPRLKADDLVLGVRVGDKTKAYPLKRLTVADVYHDTLGGEKVVVFHNVSPFNTTTAYKPVARQPRKFKGPEPDKNGVSPPNPGVPLPDGKELPPVKVDLKMDSHGYAVDFPQTATLWDAAGRGASGKLKGWTLEPVDSVVCKWFAWSAEYPDTAVFGEQPPEPEASATGVPKKDDAIKEIAGAAEFLRLLPKPFATLKAVDAKARTVTLQIEGETDAKVWRVEPDTEVKVRGFWGRLEQLQVGDRVWVWLKLNSKKVPVSVVMIADEMSEQDIHGDGITVAKITDRGIVVQAKKRPDRTLGWVLGRMPPDAGSRVYLQSTGTVVRAAADPKQFEELRQAQKEWMRNRWADEGLPGTVSIQHTFSGELEVMIDHEGMRWARWLKPGDTVHIATDPPIKAVVKSVSPWRERTQLRLVVGELAAADLKAGDRVFVKMTSPPSEVLNGSYPSDIDRPRTREQRIEWFLANTYCTCLVRGDICTGHFYTLASCNVNGCGNPNATRRHLGELIDQKLTDKQIWDALLKEKGPLMARPHLLP